MRLWMGEPEIDVKVFTNWQINSQILVTGYHHGKFENKGLVLECVPEKKLSYTHLSSASRLKDLPRNYSTFEFILSPSGNDTELTITIKNFPTDVVRKHLELFWGTTILTIKNMVEKSGIHHNYNGPIIH